MKKKCIISLGAGREGNFISREREQGGWGIVDIRWGSSIPSQDSMSRYRKDIPLSSMNHQC